LANFGQESSIWMSKLGTGLWQEMMGYMRRRHAPICRQWFDELQPIKLDSGLLQIQTANSVQQAYLQNKCRDQFTEAAQMATGALVAVRFVYLTDPAARQNGREPGYAASLAANGGGTAVTTASSPSSATVATSHRSYPLADQMVLSPDYSFDNFITGPNNQLAYAAAVAVANQPGTAYNPLFIHGGVGLGKTHLLQAICQQILTQQPQTSILYVSCDSFMNQFIDCVQSGRMNDFRHQYRHVDMLVIDDIHFLAKRDRTQEEFFHTFNDLYQSNRQIVLSSDAPPSEIPDLEERLVSRFQWGLVAHVSKPSFETRTAILKAKARLRGLVVPEEVINYIATQLDTNARELEGAITTIQGHAALQERTIDLQLTKEALGQPQEAPYVCRVTLQDIIDVVTSHYSVRLSDLQSRRRQKSITEPRQLCMWLARKRTEFSLEEIGGHFGGRDHTTVMHSIRTIEERIQQDSRFAHQTDQLDNLIQTAATATGL
jgi:chromosomal replication initiator protein